jgi:hypothetical protein
MKPCFALLIAGAFSVEGLAQSTINTSNRHAYGANTGWVDCRADGANGARVGEFVCSGYVYAANVGWINLGSGSPANGIRYQNNSATDFGVNHDGLGNLRGLAWGANIGWLTFTNQDAGGAGFDAPKVDLRTGRLSGSVYGANIGWMSLSNAFAFVQTDTIAPGADGDDDGLPDAWELGYVGNLTAMTATSNTDNDGANDLEEYLADTNPLVPGDEFRIITFSFSSGGTNAFVTWTSRPTRSYFAQKRLDFDSGTLWSDGGLGLIFPDAGATTSRVLFDNPGSHRFLRIEAVRPLAP